MMTNNNQEEEANSSMSLENLGRLADILFAIAMGLMIIGFDIPESVKTMTDKDINQFLLTQLQPLMTYVVSFTLVAFYWIEHGQQFKYYRRVDEGITWISIIYLMSLFLIPYSNALLIDFPDNVMVKVWFGGNIFLIGFFSFISWVYATYNYRLVDGNLDRKIILSRKVKSLIEPAFALLSIGVAFINQSWSDYVWFLIPIPYIFADKLINLLDGRVEVGFEK